MRLMGSLTDVADDPGIQHTAVACTLTSVKVAVSGWTFPCVADSAAWSR